MIRIGALLVVLSPLALFGAPSEENIRFFETKVRPVLAKHCANCHGAAAKVRFAELLVDSREGLLKGGLSGPAIVPGDPAASKLMEAVRYESDRLRMPPTGKLPVADIDALSEWIAKGAPWPEEAAAAPSVSEAPVAGPDPRLAHWAFQPVSKPAAPSVRRADWALDDIDRFVLARLEVTGFEPAPDAERATWLRRVTFDLTGLPPTPAEIEAFAADASPEAYERVVDRLLGAPEFGERWARHWLDLTGYADNIGLGRRIPAREPWRYRDYVVESFNRDKPYDLFVREQIAGDVMEYADDLDRREKIVATGFLAIGPWALVNSDKVQLRMDVVDHQIDTVGRSLLGLTLGCARCHDHKFDPVAQRDYYAMAGVFRSTATLEGRMSGVFSDVHRTPLPETPEELIERARALERWTRDWEAARAAHGEAQRALAELEKRAKADGGASAKEEIEAARKLATERKLALDTIAFNKPGPPMAMALRDLDEPEDAALNLGGNPHMLSDRVPRGFLPVATVGEPPRIATRYNFEGSPRASSGRRELARWLTDPKNPLPARVMANRVWLHLFGAGIVSTPDNFGLRGETPSHPELLDHVATRFVEGGWSVKSLIRAIALSRTYRQSAAANANAQRVDPDNRLLWRANRRRLEAEAYRDAVLAVSGKLDRRRGGFTLPIDIPGNVALGSPPAVRDEAVLGDDRRFRRTVYLPTVRKSQMKELDVLNLFDFPDPNTTTGARAVTTVPTQALFLMNSPFILEQAGFAAAAILERRASDEERVAGFLVRALGRTAGEAETAAALDLIRRLEAELGREAAWARWCHTILISNEFLFRS